MKRNFRNQATRRTGASRTGGDKWCVKNCRDGTPRHCGSGHHPESADCTAICAANDPCPEGTQPSWSKATGLRTGEPTRFQRRRIGGTGQPAAWRNVGGTILGYTTQQVLIAVGVGVAAYFLYKKFAK